MSIATLAACATSPGPDRPSIEPDPIIEVRHERTVVCPAELDQALPDQPEPGEDAVIRFNGPGGDYLADLVAWGRGLADRLTDARAACSDPSS